MALAGVQVESIPAELRGRRQWVVWRYEERDGKRTKVPYRISSPSRRAKADDPSTWETFAEAVAVLEDGGADGIGYVFSKDDDLCGVDLDACFEDGNLHPEAAAIVLALDSYTERSVSGAGVHVIARASVNGSRNRTGRTEWSGEFECYDAERYFAFTGEHLRGTPTTIEARQVELDEVLARIFPARPPAVATPVPPAPIDLDDEELLERAFAARNGRELRALWDGAWESRYPSQSEADLALVGGLAFWAGSDAARIDTLFRRSRLFRAKWDERRGETTYGMQTIARALEGRTDFYGPRAAALVHSHAASPPELTRGAPPGEEAVVRNQPYEPLDLDAFLTKPPADPDWDWHGYYARGDVVLEAGDPGVGKSLNAQARGVKAATGGGDHLGEPVAGRRVVYLDLESPDDVVYQRLHGFGLRRDVDGFAYVHRPPGLDLLDAVSLSRFRETLVSHRVELAVVDSLRRAAPGLDENDSRQVSLVFSALREIAKELRVTIVVIHHPRKPVGDAKVEAIYAARGSGDLIGSVDSYLFHRRLGGGLVRIEHGKARRGREHAPVHYRIVEGEDGGPAIEHVEVEQAPADEELDEAVVEYVNAHPGASTKHVEEGVKGGRGSIRKALKRLSSPGELQRLAVGPGRVAHGKYYYPLNHAALNSPGEVQATFGEMSPAVPQGQRSPNSPRPRRGGELGGDLEDNSPEIGELDA